jgi:predicted amidohydrolase
MFKVGFFQFYPAFGEVAANLKYVLTALQQVRADVIVLPELAFTGYYFKDREELARLAENPRSSAAVESLVSFCKERQLHLVAGFAEKAADKIFNSALLIGPDGLRHIYRKLHLFNTEVAYFDPGDTPLEVISVNGVNLGLMICFDWIFPEVARSLTLMGADILCQPANLVLSFCQKVMISRSIENGVYTVTANRYGAEERPHGALTFTGQSQITDPKGNLLGQADPAGDSLVIVDIDPQQARQKHITARNDLLSDRRPEFYQLLTSR